MVETEAGAALLARVMAMLPDSTPAPYEVECEDGELCLEWRADCGHCWLDVWPDGRAVYLLRVGDGKPASGPCHIDTADFPGALRNWLVAIGLTPPPP